MKVYGQTDKGMVRETNQDYICFGKFSDNVPWAIVCDGMGGSSSGDVASKVAAQSIRENIEKLYKSGMHPSNLKNLLLASVNIANINVFDLANEDEKHKGMGTTVVAAILKEGVASIVNVGDSRAYIIGENEVTQLTKDHSMVQELIDQGKITKEEAETHPKKNIITRAVGALKEVDADYTEVDISPGDKLLLCTDGLTNCLSAGKISEIVFSEEDPEKICEKLIEAANERGGPDNISCVYISE